MSVGAASATATASGRWAGGARQEADLADRALGLGVVGIAGQDRLIGGFRGVEVAVVEVVARGGQLGVDLFGLAVLG